MGNVIEDYKDVFGKWRKSLVIEGIQFNTVSGSRWGKMHERCKVGGYFQKENQHMLAVKRLLYLKIFSCLQIGTKNK